jgi:hypothetical protein
MNFTAAGLARIKTPDFLHRLEQVPQDYGWLISVVIEACSDDQGCLVHSDEGEIHDFITTHREQFADIMMEVQTAFFALQTACGGTLITESEERID